jgi:peptide-methionine (R)-S-oxide reductase
MNRRSLLITAAALLALPRVARAETFEISLTDAEWHSKLNEAQYYVLREEGTERAGSSKLDKTYAAGTYHCAGCDLAVFSSEAKFDSGTGWPSFFQPLENAIGTKDDSSLFSSRTEVHCRRCGGHFGHVFNDGPQPTGLRYCMNGVALSFKAA